MNKLLSKLIRPVRLSFLALFFIFTTCISRKTHQSETVAASALENGFRVPPDSVKPSVYWYWLDGNVSKEGVIKDLEAMAEVGIGRAFIGNISLGGSGKVKLFTPEWYDITSTAIKEAGRVGIDIGLFNSPGWSMSGGPWVKPNEAMRYLTSTQVTLKGPQKYEQKLATPKGDYQDVVLLAYPAFANDKPDIASANPKISSQPNSTAVTNLADGNTATESLFPETKAGSSVTYDIETAKSFTARSLALYPALKPTKANVELQVNEGNNFRTLKKFEFNRINPELNVGYMPYSPVIISFPAVEAKKFRLILSQIEGKGGLAEIKLSTEPQLEYAVEKQLGKMFPTPLPLWDAYQWPVQTEPEKSLTVDPAKVLNITQYLAKDGTLRWQVPAGNWVVMRVGMLPTGITNAPAAPEGRGLEIDKLNKQVLDNHFNAYVGEFLKRIPAAERKALKWVVADSYETGSQNWSDKLADDFKQRYGYDPLPWLPVINGKVVGSAGQSDRFLWDLRRLIADQVAYQYVGGLREVSNKQGLKLWLENYGHWGYPGEFLQYGGQSDEVAGEFWNEGDLGSIELRAASSAAHIYGKNKVAAESFTAAGKEFQRYPGMLKKRTDWSFTEGVNNTLLHLYITQPFEDRNPGMNAWFSTEFNRKNTWFYQSKHFIDYLRRCMFLLQQGRPVVDVAYFIGEDAPKMIGTTDPALPAGYSFDYINSEVILNRLQVQNGKLVLPNGIAYSLLVLPKLETMRPEVLRKIKELVAAGGAIYGPAPHRSPSLQNYPQSDIEIKRMAQELWGTVDGNNVKSGSFGKGKVLAGMDMQAALDLLNVIPDFSFSDKVPVLYTHRSTPEGEIYFVSNQSDQSISIAPKFRVTGKQPELWDATTGQIRTLPVFTQNSGSTEVPLKLEAYQSVFILFRKPIPTTAAVAADNFPEAKVVAQVSGPWEVTFDASGRGPDKPVMWNQLTDWTASADDRIKYYSGTATYRNAFKTFKLKPGQQLILNLGTVRAMAQVKVNGMDVGGIWTAPWQVNITQAVKPGHNKVEIEVVNTWVNRLIGDSRLPPEQRKTWTVNNPYKPTSALEPSGLIGPVTLQVVDYGKAN